MIMSIVPEDYSAISRAPIRNHAWMATVTKRPFNELVDCVGSVSRLGFGRGKIAQLLAPFEQKMGLDDHLIGKSKKEPLAAPKSELSGVGNPFNVPPGTSSISDTEDRPSRRPTPTSTPLSYLCLWISAITGHLYLCSTEAS